MRSIKALLAGSAAAACMFAASPRINAAAPNGTYRIVNASGTAVVLGEEVTVTREIIDQFGLFESGRLEVAGNKIVLDRTRVAQMIQDLGEQYNIPISVKISGPNSLTLRRKGRTYTGRTTSPVKVKFSANYQGQSITGQIQSKFSVKVMGRRMTVQAKVSGSALGAPVRANLKIIGARMP